MGKEIQDVKWPDWEVVRKIGSGSFGTVYEIQRDVYGDVEKAALKVITVPHNEDEVEYLRCTGLDDASITQTFHQQVGDIAKEYKLMAQMRENPNVVHCNDFRDVQHDDKLGWDIYIKMELLSPLMKCLDKVSTETQIIQLGKDICNALISCQEKGIIHRDIKPQNVFVSYNGAFKLGDFGIARTIERTTRATAGIGTYSYMAPEVEKNESYGFSADICSLGLLMYWLLNERRGPFMPLPPAVPKYDDEEKARYRRFSGETIPAPKNGGAELKAVVLKACSYNAKERYQTAKEMYEALNNINGSVTPISNDDAIDNENNQSIQEDEVTTGPNFVDSHQEKTDVAENDASEVTVGPIFRKGQSRKEDVQKYGDGLTLSAEKNAVNRNKKILFFKIASIVLGVIAIILIFLLWRSCGGATIDSASNYTEPVAFVNGLSVKTKPSKTSYYVGETLNTSGLTLIANYSDGTNTTITNGYTCSPTIFSTAGTQTITVIYGGKTATFTVNVAAVIWSEWVDELPEGITADKYEIEEKTLYSSRTQETTSSTEKNTMDGWELYDTVEANGEFGPWSDWSATKVEASATREVDTQTRYRYRDKETTTSSSSTKDGWTKYDTTYSWGNYGSWSSWSTSAVSNSDSRKVETKTQYRYRSISYSTEYTSWSSWSDWQGSAVPETDMVDVETRTAYRYYYYTCNYCGHRSPASNMCYSWEGGCGRGSCSFAGEIWLDTPYSSATNFGVYEIFYITVNGQKLFAYTYTWSDHYVAPITQYKYRTRSTQQITNYGNWSSWGDTAYSSSSTREVQTRTVYRYCDRSQVATYHFYRWGSWSAWSENKVSGTNDRQVENATYYRYRDQVKTTTYYFKRWTNWSTYSETVVTPTETVEVQTKTQYRYKAKGN